MKKLLLTLLLILSTSLLFAQKADQMIGVTAMQFARGGAIIASPVDAPSMIYNPAAIGALDFDIIAFDHSLGVVNPPRKITSPTGTTESGANSYLGMGSGFVYKITDKIILGMAAGGVSGLGVDFPASTLPDFPYDPAASTGTPFPDNVSIVSKKGLLKITPTIAYKISDGLSIGASLQIGNQSLALKSPAFILPQSERWGFGGSIGLIYKPLQNLSLGLSYTSKMEIAEYEFNGTSLHPMAGGEGVYTMQMNSPQNIAFGVAYAPMSKLLLEADVKWVNQSAVMDVIKLQTPNTNFAMDLNFGWDDQIIYALGAEFQAGKCLKVIGGWSYGATPIGPEDVANNLGSIAVVEHHISLGVNKSWNDNLSSTLSYTRGLHNSVKSDTKPLEIEAEFNMFHFQLSYRM